MPTIGLDNYMRLVAWDATQIWNQNPTQDQISKRGLATDLFYYLKNNGFNIIDHNGSPSGSYSEDDYWKATKIVFEPTVAVNSLHDDKQIWRLGFTIEGYGTPEWQALDPSKRTADPIVGADSSAWDPALTSFKGNQLVAWLGVPDTMGQSRDSAARDYIPDMIAGVDLQPKIDPRVVLPTGWSYGSPKAHPVLLVPGDDDVLSTRIGPSFPYSARISITPRGIALIIWESSNYGRTEDLEYGGVLCIQRPVKSDGSVLVDGYAPVFAVHNTEPTFPPATVGLTSTRKCVGTLSGRFYRVMVREKFINIPTVPRIPQLLRYYSDTITLQFRAYKRCVHRGGYMNGSTGGGDVDFNGSVLIEFSNGVSIQIGDHRKQEHDVGNPFSGTGTCKYTDTDSQNDKYTYPQIGSKKWYIATTNAELGDRCLTLESTRDFIYEKLTEEQFDNRIFNYLTIVPRTQSGSRNIDIITNDPNYPQQTITVTYFNWDCPDTFVTSQVTAIDTYVMGRGHEANGTITMHPNTLVWVAGDPPPGVNTPDRPVLTAINEYTVNNIKYSYIESYPDDYENKKVSLLEMHNGVIEHATMTDLARKMAECMRANDRIFIYWAVDNVVYFKTRTATMKWNTSQIETFNANALIESNNTLLNGTGFVGDLYYGKISGLISDPECKWGNSMYPFTEQWEGPVTTDLEEYVLIFPFGLCSSTVAYTEEMDMIALSKGSAFQSSQKINLTVYSEITQREYIGLSSNFAQGPVLGPHYIRVFFLSGNGGI